MDVENKIKDLLRTIQVARTPWQFVTSGGGELTVGTPIARLSVGATAGAMWIRYGSDQPIRLNYGGVGGAVGLSLVPFPGNFSFSLPSMPNAGVIYKLPFAGKTLSKGELTGMFVMMEVCLDWGAGLSGTVMFIGGSPYLVSVPGPLALPALIATSNACVRFGGLTATVLPVNASVNAYLGLIY